MSGNIYLYIIVMAGVTYAIRALPLTIFKKPIENQFIQSFLYYVPYVTLAVMVFPSIMYATSSPISGCIALVVGIIVAYIDGNLFRVAVCCCLSVLICELII